MIKYSIYDVMEMIQNGEKYRTVSSQYAIKEIEKTNLGIIKFKFGGLCEDGVLAVGDNIEFVKVEPKIEFKCAYVQYEPDGDERLVAVGEDVDNPTRLEFAVLVDAYTGKAIHFCKVCEIVTRKLTKEEYLDMPYIIEA